MKIKFTVEANIENGKLSGINISNVTKVNEVPNGYVDLGLPSGTLWAKCNYGAKSEIEDGGYFTWGEAMKLPITLPTKEQFEELLEHTDHRWIGGDVLGIGGMKFVSKVNPSKYIFIPASGYAYNGSVRNRGSYGCVWSSSLHADYPNYAWRLKFRSSGMGVYYYSRYGGFSVRGVIPK